MPFLVKVIFVIGMLVAFILGCLLSTWVITGVKLEGTIVVDTEHYSKPAHFFKFKKPLSSLLASKYVMFEVETGDLRPVFGKEKKLDIGKEM